MKRAIVGLALAITAPWTVAQDAVDHSKMDHSQMDHSKMDHAAPPAQEAQEGDLPRTPIPMLTDADRAAARLPAGGHAAHGDAFHSMVALDRLEAWDSADAHGGAWELHGWVGKDLQKLRFRAEGETEDGALDHAELDVLYSRAVTPWWDTVVGLHHESGPATRDALAIGVMGLAPYKIETQAMLYLGDGGASLRAEASYDTFFTNRWILQSRVALRAESRDDAARDVGAGLSTLEAGLRLRYEWHRQFAPYLGIEREQAFGGTADQRRDRGDPAGAWRVVLGLRTWF